MKTLLLAAGVAALAITAPVAADPGNKGGGKDRGAKVEKAERGGKARVAQAGKQKGADRVERRASRADRPVKAQRQKAERAETRIAKAKDKVLERRAKAADVIINRKDLKMESRAERQRSLEILRAGKWDEDKWDDGVMIGRRAGWDAPCPPGLAKKPIPCIPPGHAKALVGEPLSALARIAALSEVPQRLRVIYPDTDDYYYRLGNGYLYQVDRETQLINALLPLFGLGVGVGQPFPASVSNFALPMALQPFYPDTPLSEFRYANGYVYQVDPITGLVEDVDPMLGFGHGYGQMMPLSYSAYNLPHQYRPFYADTSSHYFRYAPGAIYRVDSGSGLIDAVAALLTGGMTVGQPMPMGYDVYNVPLAYRAQYPDTPDSWFRYSNGHIYQIDPTTRLVTALISALT